MFELQGKPPFDWETKNQATRCSYDIPLGQSSVEGFSLRLLQHQTVAEWLLCRHEFAVPATIIDEASCFFVNSHGLVNCDALLMLQPIGIVDSILLGYSFGQAHELKSSSNAEITCQRFAFDVNNWEYLELTWYANATVNASWAKFLPSGQRTKYFVLYEAPPEGKLPYNDHVESKRRWLFFCRENRFPLGIQENIHFGVEETYQKRKLSIWNSFQLFQRLFVGDFRGTQRFTKYEADSGFIMEELVHSFRTFIEHINESHKHYPKLEKVKQMQRLCFLPRTNPLECSRVLHDILANAGILLEYCGPDHFVDEEAQQKRLQRRLLKRRRGKNAQKYGTAQQNTTLSTNKCSNHYSVKWNTTDRLHLEQENTLATIQEKAIGSPSIQRIVDSFHRSSSPNLSQSSISTQTSGKKRPREQNLINSSLVSLHSSCYESEHLPMYEKSIKSMNHTDSFDPSLVTEEPSEHRQIQLMLGRYGNYGSSVIEGNMIGFSSEKESRWMLSTTEPESRLSDNAISNHRKESKNSGWQYQWKQEKEERDWTVNDFDNLEDWPSPMRGNAFPWNPSLEEEEPFYLGNIFTPFNDFSVTDEMLYSSSESSDWFLKTLTLETSSIGTVKNHSLREMDSGIAQVEAIDKRSSHMDMFSNQLFCSAEEEKVADLLL
eukprot:jgi/Galph1/5448/GphlegSOOS_G4083.1